MKNLHLAQTSIFKLGLGVVSFAFLLTGCQKGNSDDLGKNIITAAPGAQGLIGEGTASFMVLGQQNLSNQIQSNQILAADAPAATQLLEQVSSPATSSDGNSPRNSILRSNDSLVLGFPLGLLHEEQLFGGVITQVSDTQNADLGDLKLTDLRPFTVRTEVVGAGKDAKGHQRYAFALVGCADGCTENSEQKVLVAIPVVGVDSAKQMLMVDLAALGDMNLLSILDPDGKATELKAKSSKTMSFDYSLSTLVFDVQATMVPIDNTIKNPHETTITTRWYLRLASTFNPAFEPRPATDGVGYFMTEVSAEPKIERRARPFSGSDLVDDGVVHYYVKNVPAEYRPAFKAAFDDWNTQFTTLLGGKIFSYEFVDATDPKAALLVPGDPRYNILEWDLVNEASYGGLGPSLANQYTGEIFSANVLVQGPTIVKMYSEWFKASQTAAKMVALGQSSEAELFLKDTLKTLTEPVNRMKARTFNVSLGSQLNFKVNSHWEPLRDPMMERDDFDPVPAGFTYNQYMAGYFRDMVSHELGHNLGLRHNFRGSLGATNSPGVGNVSISVMEYLGRGFRAYDRIGSFDQMAIKYGYMGTLPDKTDEFCTDENNTSAKKPQNSAECSSNDATNDPFSWLEARLDHAIDLLLNRNEATAPVWTVKDMSTELGATFEGLAAYASSAEKTSDKWTNFFGKGDRPATKAGVKAYVLGKIKSKICDPSLDSVISSKASDARSKATENLAALRAQAVALITPMKVFTADDLKCE
jgi:hypothetical protein